MDDMGHSGIPFTNQSASGSLTITVTGDHAPVVVAPSSITIDADTTVTLSDANANAISVTDLEGDNVIVTISAEHGTLTIGTTSGSTLILNGTPAQVTDSMNGMIFTPDAGYFGTDANAITVAVLESSTPETLSASSNISMTVTRADHAPTVSAPASVTIAEDTSFSLNRLECDCNIGC